jgi:hypothetical protein
MQGRLSGEAAIRVPRKTIVNGTPHTKPQKEDIMKRKKTSVFIVMVFGAAALLALSIQSASAKRGSSGGRGGGPIVYVTSQGLYYDSIVTADPLPAKGPFQQLFPPTTNPEYPFINILSTEHGPGNPGYVGGRWWVDIDGDGEMSAADHYFICPLLGPGRAEP